MFEAINKRLIDKKWPERPFDRSQPFWDEETFHLEGVKVFKDLSADAKKEVLRELSQEIIEESIFIERVAIDFASYMTFSCEDRQQKEAYSLMNTEEVSHYYMLLPFLTRPLGQDSDNKFMRILNGVMATKSKPIMIFFGQVLLEGLSSSYYKNLSASAQCPELKKVLHQIYLDEAAHHSIGLQSLKHDSFMTSAEKALLFDFIEAYLNLQHSLYPRIIGGFSKSLGGLNRVESAEVYEQMKASMHLQSSLDRIRKLLSHNLTLEVVEILDEKNLFKASEKFN